jgi:hypothetical protein
MPVLDAHTAKEGEAEHEDPSPLDGVIGRLEIYRSGAVNMSLGNGIVLNVSPFPCIVSMPSM